MSEKGKDPKAVDNMFGDDAGFLSGIGIKADKKQEDDVDTVDTDEYSSKKPESSTKKSKKPKKDDKKSDDFDANDIKPSLKEARVIKKAKKEPVAKKKSAPKKDSDSSKKDSGVDDLINKKRKEASYDASFRTPNKRRGRGGRPKFTKNRRSSKAVTIGVTKKNASSQQPKKKAKKKKYQVSENLKKKTTVTIGESIVVKEFSEKMGVPLQEVMKVLLSNKILVAAQASIDFDTAALIATEFDVTVKKESSKADISDVLEGNLESILKQDANADDSTERPPIVTVMGHVDHGKTQLLDYLRKTDVVGGEAGGITQSIGASQVHHNDQKITFIDTPGHELFTSLRARGSKITNIVIVAVAVDDGVKPQTIEAIKHAQDAGVPIIVALTKIDLGTEKLEEIKGQLAKQDLQPEERGGDTMLVPCSAMTGQGMDDLLDAVLLQYEMLELTYSPSRNAVGVVLEAHKDAKQGVTTSLLIMTGTMRVGDRLVVHNTSGKVRRMTDRAGNNLKEATGGDPVMILGIQDLPEPGRVVEVVDTEKEVSEKINAIEKHQQDRSKEAVLQGLLDKIEQGDTVDLKLILKADSYGSLEAIKHASTKVTLPENIELKIIHDDVGSITDGDLTFAQAAEAIIVGFNVGASGSLKKKADQLSVTIKEYDIIYQFIDYLDKVGQGMIEEEQEEVRIGKMEVLGVFYTKGKEMIFGGRITEGVAKNGSKMKVFRDEELEKEDEDERVPAAIGTVTSLQKEQESVNEIAEGYECGIKSRMSQKVKEGDIVEFWELQTV